MTDDGIVIEFGHAYLEDLEDGTHRSPDTRLFDETTRYLDEHDVPYDVVVVVDDTDVRYDGEFGTAAFDERKRALAQGYVDDLPVEPDGTFFESQFGDILRRLTTDLPRIDNGDMGRPGTWGVRETTDKAYIYGTHVDGQGKPKMKLADDSADADKAAPFTCEAYDAAMALAKTGVAEGPAGFPAREQALTIHDQDFIMSEPHVASHTLQRVLHANGVIDAETYRPPRHLEVGPNTSFDALRTYLGAGQDA